MLKIFDSVRFRFKNRGSGAKSSHSISFSNFKNQLAFTLAECLITLGIIGIVAAITIPSLLQSHYNHITEVRLKKFYADMNNAIRMSEIENGPHQYWSDYWALNNLNNAQNVVTPQKIEKVVNKYFAPFMKISKMDVINGIPYFVFPDGSAFAYINLDSPRDIAFFPMNYKKIASQNKRQAGVNSFTFEFLDQDNVPNNWRYVINKGLVPYLFDWDGTVSGLTKTSAYSPCTNKPKSGGRGGYCTELLRRNGWKVPKDYPFKIKY